MIDRSGTSACAQCNPISEHAQSNNPDTLHLLAVSSPPRRAPSSTARVDERDDHGIFAADFSRATNELQGDASESGDRKAQKQNSPFRDNRRVRPARATLVK